MFSAFEKFGRLGASASAAPFSPTKLFAAGEAGGVWDFTTLANLYQDSAGTSPVTSVGQTIGKVLDTSGRDNHLTQSTSTKRPLLGRMPATGVRNLLTYSEDLTNAAWTKQISTALTATTFSVNSQYGNVKGGCLVIAGQTYTFSVMVAAVSGNINLWWVHEGIGAGNTSGLNVTSTPTRYSITLTATATTYITIGVQDRNASGHGIIYMSDAQLELGSTATAYQKVGAAYDVTESGVADVYTAYFDGVDDALVSPSIDFTGTDAMSVFAGFRKTSDEARGMVLELSATTASNNGSFALTAPNAASATIVYESKGTALTDTSATIAAPADSVIAAVSDISADSNVLRRNGVEAESDTGDQGTGNYGNYAIYVGQRGASSLPYKGFMTALSARGATTDAATIVKMEQWLAAKTPGVALP